MMSAVVILVSKNLSDFPLRIKAKTLSSICTPLARPYKDRKCFASDNTRQGLAAQISPKSLLILLHLGAASRQCRCFLATFRHLFVKAEIKSYICVAFAKTTDCRPPFLFYSCHEIHLRDAVASAVCGVLPFVR